MVKKAKMTDAEQMKAFKQAARELGCDDDEKAFDKKLKKVATASSGASKDKITKQRKG